MVDIYYNNSYNMMVFRNSKQKVYFNKTEGGNMTIGNKIKNLRNHLAGAGANPCAAIDGFR